MPANSMMLCHGNRNRLSILGGLQKQDKLNPVFISPYMGNFGNTERKDMAERLSYDIPIAVETAVIKDNQPIQQQIDETIKPKNTALKVGINRQIGDISDTLTGGRFMKRRLGNTNERIHKGTGIFNRIQGAIDFVESGIALKEGISDIAEAGSTLAFGPIGTYLSNAASEKFNKNPNWRSGFPGEKHAIIDTPWGLTRANYLGPGTHVLERLERGDPPVDGLKGLDAAAKKHDIAYGLARSAEDVRKADDDFLKDLSNVESSTAMKNFVMGLFKTKKLAEDVGFLDPAKFAPDIKREIEGMGLGQQMHKAEQLGKGFQGYSPKGSFSQENVTMGAGVKDISKFIKKDLSVPLKQLRSIAFSVPGVQEKVEEVIEEFLPGQQLREKLMGMTKQTSKGKAKKKGKGFSAENVMMGVGIPKQEEFSGHILASNVPKKDSAYKYGVKGDRIAHEGIYHGIGQPGGRKKKKAKKTSKGKAKKKRTQEGGQILASIIAGVVVPELVKFVGEKIAKAVKGKKKQTSKGKARKR